MADDIRPDEIIDDLGGCGRYQWRLNIVFHIMKTAVCFSVMSMVIMSQTPTWSCANDCNDNTIVFMNTTETAVKYIKECPTKSCLISNSSISCTSFRFYGEAETFVSEVCDFFLYLLPLQ